MQDVHFIETGHGVFRAVWTGRGLYSLKLPQAEPYPDFRTPELLNARQAALIRLLKDYLAGRAVDFRSIPLDRSGYTPFQRAVFDVVTTIPPGQTLTYAETAARAGRPRAARAVGNALGINRTPVVMPCHRVVRSDGRIGGFSGGAGWKERLLAIESGKALQ